MYHKTPGSTSIHAEKKQTQRNTHIPFCVCFSDSKKLPNIDRQLFLQIDQPLGNVL